MIASISAMFAPRGACLAKRGSSPSVCVAHRDAQAPEDLVGVGGDQHLGAVRGRVHVGRRDTGQHRAGAAAGDAGDLVVGHRRLHQRGDRLVDGDVDLLAASAARSLGHRGEGADHGEHGGQRVTQADAGAGRREARVAGRVPDAAHRLADAAEAGVVRARSGLPEARDVHHDQPRVDRGQRRVVQAPLGERARPEVLEDDVDLGRERAEQVAALRATQVDRHRPLVAGDGRPPQALAVGDDSPAAHRVAGLGGLDLDHLGAVVAEELAGERAGDEAAELEDPEAGEWSL